MTTARDIVEEELAGLRQVEGQLVDELGHIQRTRNLLTRILRALSGMDPEPTTPAPALRVVEDDEFDDDDDETNEWRPAPPVTRTTTKLADGSVLLPGAPGAERVDAIIDALEASGR